MKLRATLNKFFGIGRPIMTMTANKSANYPQEVIDSMVSAYEANPTRVTVNQLALDLTRLSVLLSLNYQLWACTKLSLSQLSDHLRYARLT